MMPKSKTAVLLWSLPEEPDFVSYLERSYGDFVMCPLRFDAMETARRFVPEERLLDVSSLISVSEREDIDRQFTERLNAFYEELKKYDHEPWLACVDLANESHWFFYVFYWKAMLAHLAEHHGVGRVVLYGPFSRGSMPGGLLAAPDVLEIMVDRHNAGCVRAKARMRGLLRRSVSLLGWWLNRHSGPFSVRTVPAPPGGRRAATVVCGLDESDRRSQEPLVEGLIELGVGNIRWVVAGGDKLPVSEDETRGDRGRAGARAVRDEHDELRCFRWRHGWLERLSECRIADMLALALCRTLDGVLGEEDCGRLAEVIRVRNSGLRLGYQSMAEMVGSSQPSLVVGSSLLGPMAFVRAWARRSGVRFLLLPHGVQTYVRESYAWDADCVGAMGRHHAESLLRHHPDMEGRIVLTGSTHLGQQARQGGVGSAPCRRTDPWRACLLVRYSGKLNYPDSPAELEADLRSLAQALAVRGGLLSVRCHPRQATWDLATYKRIAARISGMGFPIELSDPLQSLNRELAESSVAIIRDWSGAGIVALYSPCPLLGWIPRPLPPESAEIIGGLPWHARDTETLAAMAQQLSRDDAFRTEAVVAQRKYLDHLVEDPWGDSYARSAAIVREEHLRGMRT